MFCPEICKLERVLDKFSRFRISTIATRQIPFSEFLLEFVCIVKVLHFVEFNNFVNLLNELCKESFASIAIMLRYGGRLINKFLSLYFLRWFV